MKRTPCVYPLPSKLNEQHSNSEYSHPIVHQCECTRKQGKSGLTALNSAAPLGTVLVSQDSHTRTLSNKSRSLRGRLQRMVIRCHPFVATKSPADLVTERAPSLRILSAIAIFNSDSLSSDAKTSRALPGKERMY